MNYSDDTTPPTATGVSGNATYWTNQNVTLSVDGAADSGSGLASEAYSFSTDASTNYWQASNTKTFEENCTVYIKVRDNDGNILDLGSQTIQYIDKVKPSSPDITGIPTTWTNQPYTLHAHSTDDASGMWAYSFSSIEFPGEWTFGEDKQMSEGGVFYVYAIDNAGNVSPPTAINVSMFDDVAPAINSIDVSESTEEDKVKYTVDATDDHSGIASYSFDGGTNWQQNNYADVDADSTTNQVKVKDNAGNIGTETVSSGVPQFYMDGQLVGLVNTTSNTDEIQYKVGAEGTWEEYTGPFTVPAFETTTVYARLGDEGVVIHKDIPSVSKYYGSYSESSTDFSLSYRNVNFDFTRSYDSADHAWFFGTDSKVKKQNSSVYKVTLPDATELTFVKESANLYKNELNGYTLTINRDNNNDITSYQVAIDDTSYFYGADKKLSRITSKYGDQITFDWSSNGVDIYDGATNARHYTVAINSDGNVTSVTDPANNTITYTYDNNGNLTGVTDQAGVTIGSYSYVETSSGSGIYTMTKSLDKNIQYNTAGRVTKELWDSGFYTNYTYDDENITVSTYSSDTNTTETSYNDAFLVTSATDENGETTEYTYNDQYQVTSETVGNKTTTYTYDAEGNLTRTVDEDNNQTVYIYNGTKQLVRETSPDGTTYYVYYGSNENGGAEGDLKLTATLKKSYTGTAPESYDSSLSCFETVSYTYDNGLVTQTVDSLNSETTNYVYDQYGNVTRTSVAKTETDATTGQTSSSLTVTDNTYDLFNRTLTTSTATNSTNTETTSTIYDAAGRTLKSDVKGDVTRTLYDSLGRVIQEIGPEDYDSTKDGLPNNNTYSDASAGTTYVYASNNTLSSETNRLGKTTNYYYNDRGCKTREEFDIYKFYYRDHGELTQVRVNNVQKVLYGYENSTNLLQTVTYANDDVINYYYDSDKNLISEKRNNNNSAYVTYSYNSDNELTQKINYDTGLKYVYGSNDSVTVTKLSDDSVVQTYTQSSNEDQVDSEDAVVTTINESHFGTSYSSQITNRSTTFTAGSNSVNYSFTNNDNNNIATEAVKYNNASAFTTSYGYDAKDNITSKAITLADNTTINVVNTYDSKNRITSTGYGSAQQTYSYDQYGQLTQTVDTANGFTETYSYDQRGNILSKTKVYDDTSLPAETTTFSYGNSAWQDELTAVNGTSLTYDANGNVLTYGNMEFEWTNGRVLSQITVNPTDPNGTANVYSYTYDESGIRSSKTVNGVTTYFTTKDGVIQSQTDGTNTMYFQYDNSGNPTGFLYNGTQYFYLTNQMGDVIGIADSSGTLIATYTYGAWGEVLATTPTTAGSTSQLAIANANPLRYRGYYLDQETGYYYLQSRYFTSANCRFINEDQIELSSVVKQETAGENLFAYCYNDAINGKDPNGTFRMKRSTAMYLIDAALTMALPGLNAKMDVEARIVRGLLNGVLRLKRLKRLTAVTSKTWSLINRLQHGTIPKYKAMFSRFFTTIRKVVWRTTGYLMSTLFKSALNRLTNLLLNFFTKSRWTQHIALLTSLLTLAGWTALFLDYFSDWSLNGWIVFSKVKK